MSELPIHNPRVGRVHRRHRSRRSHPTLRVIGALMLREMSTRFGRTPGGYIWAILQPLGAIIMLSVAFSVLMRSPQLGSSFIMFKATGLMLFQLFRVTSSMVGKSLTFSRALMAYPGVTWVDAVLARFLLNALVVVIATILILGGVILFEDLNLLLDWPMIIGAVALTALLGFGFGVFNAFMFERFDVYENLWAILTAPLLITSGVIFLFDDLPAAAQEILWYNPLVHPVGMIRAGFYSVYQPQYISVVYALVAALLPLALGLLLLRRHYRELLIR
ncbi:ABC transporter permease [Pararhodobacter oceanensis]|uniref:ABC transporter permease n=1 Tax=Pararhodobacter oceanensis TaxID=2172121 RepID=UPI003A8E582D